eukprot:CAMPEP_0202899272 /NCGR_PEP_ID=MMETSP1392-20130828/7558_1 /ASSEMBLY_ACC=CAM_ASM_000868 /TAXON_ID=225041 /ORGANISM="Chlamydomonas chlamydogama, Strain SAG 11-48b" /LENGTH=79 /DNA_ID=CAMNT_0049585409 /DNA_START=13 /DNA_END=248 /DNA_ORIENTATION=+
MYYGHARCVDRWFELQGQALPYRVNVADFILDLANGDMADMVGEEGQELRGRLVAAYEGLDAGGDDGIQPQLLDTLQQR